MPSIWRASRFVEIMHFQWQRVYISGQTIRVDGASSLGSSSVVRPIVKDEGSNSESFNGFHRAVMPKVLKGAE